LQWIISARIFDKDKLGAILSKQNNAIKQRKESDAILTIALEMI
jgi:hypothetical protein